MWNKNAFAGLKNLTPLAFLLLFTTAAPLRAGETEGKQTQVLADIALAVVTCSSHPCLGDSEEDVRKELHNKIVSDNVFYYSSFAEAFPSARNFLTGVVEWDFNPGLDVVSLKVIDFLDRPSVFLAELEHVLPGCEMERDDEIESDSADDEDEGEEDATREWECTAQGYASDDILIEVYFVHGLLLLEVGP